MYTAVILLLILSFLGIAGVVEFFRHQRRLRTIPIRIHVNGTRGKSSVTRLIGAGLRAAGVPTLTKVTGTYPRLILEDGSEVAIHRRGGANIIEQVSITRIAAARRVRAVVLECMALEPQYQWMSEKLMVQATHGVITNVRLDHIDIMGCTLPEVARALAGTIPPSRPLFVGDRPSATLLQAHADKRKSVLQCSAGESISPDEMRGFSYLEHRENVALAAAVCEHLGVDRQTALRGMYGAIPDAGVLRQFEVEAGGKRMTFYNAFAANDPDSTYRVWNRLKEEIGFRGTRIVLLNTRQDRMDRARQLADLIGRKFQREVDYVFLIGQCADVVRSMCLANGVDANRIVPIGWTTPEAVFDRVLATAGHASTIVGIGNMGGMGAQVVEYFDYRSRISND